MASTTKPTSSSLLLTLLLLVVLLSSLSTPSTATNTPPPDPIPSPWPPQFHSVLFMNRSGDLQKTDLWYDWPNGRNLNIIQAQLGPLKYDLEWNNGTSYVYTLDSEKNCRVLHFEVGILRPDWLDGANYLGQRVMDGFLCNVWEKADFIWYYEDVETKRPVFWEFFSGFKGHVMTFEVGKLLEDAKWQAPVYCFKEAAEEEKSSLLESMAAGVAAPDGGLMRENLLPTYNAQL